MADLLHSQIRDQLTDRRSKLRSVLASSGEDSQILRLLAQVDGALRRLDDGTYGLCKTCEEPIEPERLIADPLVQFCLDHLTSEQQRALEEDLALAFQIQAALLPPQNLKTASWETAYYYMGAGPVSGDYCDLLHSGGDLYFIVGDVSGKGIAASMLMSHLHATFRSLVMLELPLEKLVERASRMFCESTLPTHFATLVCGKASGTGDITICNAGHHPPLLLQGSKVVEIQATGLPLGLFCDERFGLGNARLRSGESIFLYTDGLVEALDTSGREYGKDRLVRMFSDNSSLSPQKLVSAALEDLRAFRSGAAKTDDLTIMAIRRM